MIRKKGNFLELYIEKIVLGVSIVLSLVMLWLLVLSGPHSVEYGGKKYSPGQIDQYIKQQVVDIQVRLDEPVEPRSYDQSYVKEFCATLECPIEGISNNVYYPLPSHGARIQADDRIYEIPQVGLVLSPMVNAIRTVAHVPTEKVDVETSYVSAPTELGDIDFVTVQASFDIVGLYRNFGNSFSGNRVRGDWRDDQLAAPVFAGVDLQRRKQLSNGNWSQWTKVSRTKIDDLSSLLDVPESAVDLKYGIEFTLDRFREFEMQKGLLQPEAYEFATNADEWLPPEYHEELSLLLKKERGEAKRLKIEQKKLAMEAKQAQKVGMGGGGMGGMMGPMGGGSRTRGQQSTRRTSQRDRNKRGTDSRSKKPKKEENSISKVFEEFEVRLLEEDTKLSNMKDPLIFWAHDDTVEPGNTYQYRIRLGAFNPIAGKNWFTKAQEFLEDQVVLWTEFSDVTELVHIPEMMHLFPLELAKDDDDAVRLKVAKYYHGKWESHDFTVRAGQTIGHSVEKEIAKDETVSSVFGEDLTKRKPGDADSTKREIDFTADAVVVDIVHANVWSGATVLKMNGYTDLLYTEDGETIKHLAVKNKNWPKDIQKEFNRVKQSEGEKVKVFYNRGQGGVDRSGQRRTSSPGGMGGMMETYIDPMMMMGPGGY